jgi:DsbC/DsbD-like thiol-disulfide interchange protein
LIDGAQKRDVLAVRRPSRARIRRGVIGNFPGRAAFGRSDPNVAVVVEIELVPGSIRDKRDPGRIGRPVRIEIVPILAIGDLL